MTVKAKKKGYLATLMEVDPLGDSIKKVKDRVKEITRTPSDQLADSISDQPSIQPSNQPTTQPTNRPNERLSGQPTERPTKHPTEHPPRRSSGHPAGSETSLLYNDPVFTITDKQATVLTFLINQRGGISQRSKVIQHTGIPEGTVKDSIRVLTKFKFISKPKKFHQGRFQGFSYSINEELCGRFLAQRLGNLTSHPTEHPSDRTTLYPSNWPSDISSSLLYNKTTTIIESNLSDHPELGYWHQKGLTDKQIEDWVKITGSLENLLQSLCHCRFEMVDLGLEESKPIDNVFNWFYRMIEKIGIYPKPKGYKSFQEKQIEEERKIIEERKKRIAELKALSREKYEQEREEEFWTMMNDKEGDFYKQCYGKLNNFEKTLKGGPVFEKSMRKAFDGLVEAKAREESG